MPKQANRATEGPAKAKKGKPDVRLCLFPLPFAQTSISPLSLFRGRKIACHPGFHFSGGIVVFGTEKVEILQYQFGPSVVRL